MSFYFYLLYFTFMSILLYFMYTHPQLIQIIIVSHNRSTQKQRKGYSSPANKKTVYIYIYMVVHVGWRCRAMPRTPRERCVSAHSPSITQPMPLWHAKQNKNRFGMVMPMPSITQPMQSKKTKKALARNAKTYPSPSAAGNPSTLRLHPQSPGLPEWDR